MDLGKVHWWGFRTIRLMISLILFGVSSSFATVGYSQSTPITLSVYNRNLKDVFKEIEGKSKYIFFYVDNVVDLNKKITLDIKNKGIDDLLTELFKSTDYTYRISDRQIFVSRKVPAVTHPLQKEEKKITGRVVNSKGEPMQGVSVALVGTNRVVKSDIDGRYEISIDQNKTILRFSFVGYTMVELSIGSKNTYNVTLQEDKNELNELVVVGFGEQRKISNIGAQSTLKRQDIKSPSGSLSTVLAGRLSGVIAVQRTGEPGKDGADIWIRGIATPNSSSPLVLVDGVERGFNDIDPEDVESLTTLKDASATAVYGVRGANGVILIKTKPGKIGKPVISADYYQSISRFTQKVDLIDGVEYMKTANEALANNGYNPKYSNAYIESTQNKLDPYLYPNVNWLDEIFNEYGRNKRMNVNVSGGSPSATYYASVSYYNEAGMTKTDKRSEFNSKISYNRYNFTTNLSLKATPTTTVDVGAQGYLGEGNYPAISSSDIYNSAMDISPVDYPKMFYVNGASFVPGINPNGGYRNPYADATRRGYNNNVRNQIYSNLRVTQDLSMVTEGLKASAMFAYDVYNEVNLIQSKRESTFYFADRSVPYGLDKQPILVQTYSGSNVLGFEQRSEQGINNKKTYLEASLTYDRTFGKHRVSGLTLFNSQQKLLYPTTTLEASIPYRMMGVAGRATYSYDDRYFAEFNIGYNGAENFSPARRYGVFPAFGIGWVVSNESFFKPLSSVISFLKFRYTDGKIGNSNVSDRRFMYLDQIVENGDFGYKLGSNTGSRINGYEVRNNAVNVGWEESRKQDLGMDLKLFDNSLSIVFDLFKEHRTNILLKRESSIPGFLGYMAAPYGNIGVVDNKGFDGTIEYSKSLGKDWSLSVRGNITYNDDKWTKSEIPDQRYPWMNLNGHNILAQKGYVAVGLFTKDDISDIKRWESMTPVDRAITPRPFAKQWGVMQPGDIKYQDLNGDGVIDSYDQTYVGRGDVPQIIYGFGFNVGYKALSIGLLFQGSENADRMVSGNSIQPFRGTGGGGNLYTNIKDRWMESNPRQDVFYPRLAYGDDQDGNTNNFQPSDWWIHDMSFVRLKTLQISYNLPKKWINAINIKNAAVYMMGNNLFTISEFKLWDPELNTNNGSKYPNTTTYSLGINFTF
ncbi:TonB-dependent receptor [Pedobacter hiemivivus]|uniref:TonB-dependent receptor n=1 Tax=Pedobacter hiemivivus TaxID=2530454 RepID=A0A4U1G1A3_9SPHI|nr:TonB-dependent receptor [Pedobacter hiemivivus]TKC57261.1 TonB-dependent receptor [Pedobacter hiemivivus]